jgi:hypothetical protein
MLYDAITEALGYTASPLFRQDEAENLIAPSELHWIRAARAAGVKGTYFFRVSPEATGFRPAVHVAEAPDETAAREIHRRLWNQGINPFLIVVLPAQVRVFAGFAFDPTDAAVGSIINEPVHPTLVPQAVIALAAFDAESIDRGELWQRKAQYLGADRRVDTTLLAHLQELSAVLQKEHHLTDKAAHALIGKFVYFPYLRARQILSDKWLADEAGVVPAELFNGTTFSPDITLDAFRRLARQVERRFNGKLFPIAWGSRTAPKADAIRKVARVFAGEDILSGQRHLPFTAYDFSNIPVEFLSSIYEQFLHSEADTPERGSGDGDPERRGAHYTPDSLADYMVAEVNSIRPLKVGMKILDPCCGSGVFLVVAFRRLVELERQRGAALAASELKELLESSVFAVERNRTACEIAGFSLILALLSYVDPPELHRRRNFKFPTLVGKNLFVNDFFDPAGGIWKKIDPATGRPIRFDWILGNPPWVESDSRDPKARHLLDWLSTNGTRYGLARARTGESFACRVMDCLADNGVVGLILHAKSLTNDQLRPWRRIFFREMEVHRLTNLSNLAYLVFASAQQPATTIIYGRSDPQRLPRPVLHFGPFVINQCSLSSKPGTKRRAWTIGFSESEIKQVALPEAQSGDAAVWKMALWGTSKDVQAIRSLRGIFSTTLGAIADQRRWHIGLGLQLRADQGSKSNPNEYVKELEGLKLLDHRALIEGGPTLLIPKAVAKDNTIGCYVRTRGGTAGVRLSHGHRLFLWNDFAAYTQRGLIFQHDKLGLAGGTEAEMKAVAALWNSSYVPYLLFFVTSAAWGIGVNQIDKGDVTRLPFPDLDDARQARLAAAWDEAAKREEEGASFPQIRALLDGKVASVLGLRQAVQTIVSDFFRIRYQLVKGKSPVELRQPPGEKELRAYATRLRDELDVYLNGAARHRVTIIHGNAGVAVSVALGRQDKPFDPEIKPATGATAIALDKVLKSAEAQFSQWAYVKRSVRLFAGHTVQLVKPPRRMEWSETQAMLDADDIIAEIIENRGKAE